MTQQQEHLSTPSLDRAVEPALAGVMAEQIGEVWPEVLPQIEILAGRSDGSHTPADIFHKLVRGECQLWRHELGIVITSLAVYPQNTACVIWGLAGHDIKAWIEEAEATISAWARYHDCVALELHGRRGWEKLLPHWKRRTLMRLELNEPAGHADQHPDSAAVGSDR